MCVTEIETARRTVLNEGSARSDKCNALRV